MIEIAIPGFRTVETLPAADVAALTIFDALELLTHPLRLKATLRC